MFSDTFIPTNSSNHSQAERSVLLSRNMNSSPRSKKSYAAKTRPALLWNCSSLSVNDSGSCKETMEFSIILQLYAVN